MTRIAASTIGRGLEELSGPQERRIGFAARRRAQETVAKDATLLDDLGALVEPTTRGRSRCRRCAGHARACAGWRSELQGGSRVSHTLVGELLEGAGLQPARQSQDPRGPTIPTATRSSSYINAAVKRALARDSR